MHRPAAFASTVLGMVNGHDLALFRHYGQGFLLRLGNYSQTLTG